MTPAEAIDVPVASVEDGDQPRAATQDDIDADEHADMGSLIAVIPIGD